MNLIHEDLTKAILKIYFAVYNELGFGFLEKVYQNALFLELKSSGFKIEAQKQIKVHYKGVVVGEYYADILVEDAVILELKACEALAQAHELQLLNYLKATEIEVGLLLNFGRKAEFRRVVHFNTP